MKRYIGRGLEQEQVCPHGIWGSAKWHTEVFCFPDVEAV